MHIFQFDYSTSDVMRAAGVKNGPLQSWLKRDLIVGHKGGGSSGRHRRFSFHNIMEIAIANTLMDKGVSAPKAFASAAHFSHFSEADEGRERDPGLPFHHNHGITIFAIGDHDRTCELIWNGKTDFYPILRSNLGAPVAMIIINASAVFDRVCTGLSVHPNDVLDWAYPQDAS